MKIDIITLFPEMFEGPFSESIIKRAVAKGIVDIGIHQLRKWTIDKHGTVDDRPYGGGPGMIMKVDVAYKALKSFKKSQKSNLKSQKSGVASRPYIILLTPKGKKFNQAMAQRLAKKSHLVFLCPHYEGYDHRIESLVDEKISIGDYILTGGEIPAMVITDAVVRLIPGAIKAESLREETFSTSPFLADARSPSPLLRRGKESPEGVSRVRYEYPQYTRPEIFEAAVCGRQIKKRVPKVLLSGNHALIAKWRQGNH